MKNRKRFLHCTHKKCVFWSEANLTWLMWIRSSSSCSGRASPYSRWPKFTGGVRNPWCTNGQSYSFTRVGLLGQQELLSQNIIWWQYFETCKWRQIHSSNTETCLFKPLVSGSLMSLGGFTYSAIIVWWPSSLISLNKPARSSRVMYPLSHKNNSDDFHNTCD